MKRFVTLMKYLITRPTNKAIKRTVKQNTDTDMYTATAQQTDRQTVG